MGHTQSFQGRQNHHTWPRALSSLKGLISFFLSGFPSAEALGYFQGTAIRERTDGAVGNYTWSEGVDAIRDVRCGSPYREMAPRLRGVLFRMSEDFAPNSVEARSVDR